MQQGAAGGDSLPQWEYQLDGLSWTSKTSPGTVQGTSAGLPFKGARPGRAKSRLKTLHVNLSLL